MMCIINETIIPDSSVLRVNNVKYDAENKFVVIGQTLYRTTALEFWYT